MEHVYENNGLVFWSEKEINLRKIMIEFFEREIRTGLLETNLAWQMIQIEAPILTPTTIINQNYTEEDVWFQSDKKLVLRPETTPGSYAFACHLIKNQTFRPPTCIWQAGKSFRREQDQVTKNMRLKEFYQQEFQCIFAADTANDYMESLIPKVKNMIREMACGLPVRVVDSDRLPSYSTRTVDIEVDNGDKWMEVCSMSLRTDFPMKVSFSTKKGQIEKDLKVFEIAIGLDRMVYNFSQTK